MDKKQILVKNVITSAISLLILIFLFYKIELRDTLEVLGNIDLPLAILAFAVFFFASAYISAYHWKIALQFLGFKISQKESFYIRVANSTFKSLLPLKSGDFVKAIYLKRKSNLDLKIGSISVIITVIFGLIVLISLSISSLVIQNTAYDNIYLLLTLSIFISLLLTLIMKESISTIYLLFKNLIKKYPTLFDSINIFRKIGIKKQIILMVIEFVMKITVFLGYYLLSLSLGLNIPFSKMLLFFPIIAVLVFIPITISGLGAREAMIVFFFSGFASVPQLLGFGIMISFFEIIFPSLISLIFMRFF